MIIRVDEEGLNIIHQLCDLALKQAGLSNLNSVNVVLASTMLISERPEECDEPFSALNEDQETVEKTEAGENKKEVKEKKED